MVKVDRKQLRPNSISTKSRSEPVCIECQKNIDENVKSLICEKCGESENVRKCSECLSMSDNFYDELINLPGNNTVHWFCPKCEKTMFKQNNDMKIESVLQLLAQAMDRISSLENSIKASQINFESIIMKRVETVDTKIQLLLDVTIPPTINETMSVVDANDSDIDTNAVSEGCNNVSVPLTRPVQRAGWSALFHRVSEVAADVQAVKEATIISNSKPDQLKQNDDDNTVRSVVVYGLRESSTGINDTLLIDHLVKSIDSTISIESHKRLRKKAAADSSNGTNKAAPLLITLSTVFDRRKLLSLAPNLRSNNSYKSVFIKKALSISELKEYNELRQKCTQANEVLVQTDPFLESKFAVIDGKIRRMTKVNDSGKYKVDWSKTFSASELTKN